jgi:formiminoglutamase
MSGAFTNAVGSAWYTRLEPLPPPTDLPDRPGDPCLGRCVEFWAGGLPALRPRRPVLIGFPQDEGVRRNGGRPGAAAAPAEIRRWLYRLTSWDGSTANGTDLAPLAPLDLGNLRMEGDLEATQHALGDVVGAILGARAVPIVLGGGHETALGHYLGYVQAGVPVGVINLDAHLDVRPAPDGKGHSGSAFRQAFEHPARPLPASRYVCLGAQPHAVSREHLQDVRGRGCRVRWAADLAGNLTQTFAAESGRLRDERCAVYVSLDADVVRSADVPAVSAPNPLGLDGAEVAACARRAGSTPGVTSFDLVEINPGLDRDGQSARWAAAAVWSFLAGLAGRPSA